MDDPHAQPLRPVMLIVLDGWGARDDQAHNAVKLANTPCLEHLEATYPHTLLDASGEAVGLPAGQMGNSEAGHLNLGAGRIVYQELTRIDHAIQDGSFFENEAFIGAFEHVERTGGALHLLGLVSDGGVHSIDEHLIALLELAKRRNMPRVYIHAFLDGRDTPPRSAEKYLKKLEEECTERGLGTVATVIGRYYAMDRDKRWERTEVAFNAIVRGLAPIVEDALTGLKRAYAAGEDDEFVKPFITTKAVRQLSRLKGEHGTSMLICDEDAVIFFNFRPDRARQLTEAFLAKKSPPFDRGDAYEVPYFVTFTSYREDFEVPVAFLPEPKLPTLGEIVSKAGKKQLRIAETEKYAHVTFFFNGGEETPFVGEDRVLVPSPKVATYDKMPEMSAPEVRDKVIEAIKSGTYDLILVNFANLDMVGHTGDLAATIQAVQIVDSCVGAIIDALTLVGGEAMITADHGNAERMLDESTGQPYTAHGTSLVKLIAVTKRFELGQKTVGKLSDVAPSLLTMLGLDVPEHMTGHSLITKISV